MPLEPIASQGTNRTTIRVSRRTWLSIGALVGPGSILAGCSSGTRREADQGRRRDAERTSVVDSMQATNSARLLDGTPDATPPTEPEE